MRIGYLRVSTGEQRLDRQVDALAPICDECFVETLSAVADRRPIYEAVVGRLGPGDALVILDLDRAFRSTRDALEELDKLNARGVEIEIVSTKIDAASPFGRILFIMMSCMGEFERLALSKRTKEGLEAARQRGQRLGRPPKMAERDVRAAKQLIETKVYSVAELAAFHNVHPWTLTRSIKRLFPENED